MGRADPYSLLNLLLGLHNPGWTSCCWRVMGFPLLALGRVSSCLCTLRMLECSLGKLYTRKKREGGGKWPLGRNPGQERVQTPCFPAESADLQWQSCIRNVPCPRGTPKAAGRLGTRRCAHDRAGLGYRPAGVGSAGFLQLGVIIVGFEQFLLSGQREWVCLPESTLL